MSVWTVALDSDSCGKCSQRIPEGAPMQLLTELRKKRCVDCKHGAVDEEAVDRARQRLEANARQRQEDEANKAADLARRGITPPPPAPVHRHRPHRAPDAFTKISDAAGSLFDPKLAAAHDD